MLALTPLKVEREERGRGWEGRGGKERGRTDRQTEKREKTGMGL